MSDVREAAERLRPQRILGSIYSKRIARRTRSGELRRFALFRCHCGTVFECMVSNIRCGKTSSCGCKSSRHRMGDINRKHGMSGTRTYNIWCGMRKRCLDSTHNSFSRYGGRGISVCDRWSSFESFFADMGEAPLDAQIDRIDNDGNYEPENCRWATPKEQSRNTRANRRLAINGVTTTMAEWAEESDVSYKAIHSRLNRGWSAFDAVFGKPQPRSRGSKNPASKLTIEDVRAIRQRSKDGDPQRLLAQMFGVSQSQIANIIHRRHWAND